jgi:hypothetical protein
MRNPDAGTARAFCLAEISESKRDRTDSGFRTASTLVRPSCAHARHARTCGRSAYLKTVPKSPTPRDRRRRSRHEPEPTDTRPPNPASRDRRHNQAPVHSSTPRPDHLSPLEIREPPSVQSSCAALAIPVRAPAPAFFDFRDARYGDVLIPRMSTFPRIGRVPLTTKQPEACAWKLPRASSISADSKRRADSSPCASLTNLTILPCPHLTTSTRSCSSKTT